MWVFTPFGFFSVVAHRIDPDVLLVRARVRADLAALAKRLPGRLRVSHTPEADYPFRLLVPRAVLADAVRRFVLEELDYPNFKTAVGDEQGPEREFRYHAVWDELRGIEEPSARRRVAPAASSTGSR